MLFIFFKKKGNYTVSYKNVSRCNDDVNVTGPIHTTFWFSVEMATVHSLY